MWHHCPVGYFCLWCWRREEDAWRVHLSTNQPGTFYSYKCMFLWKVAAAGETKWKQIRTCKLVCSNVLDGSTFWQNNRRISEWSIPSTAGVGTRGSWLDKEVVDLLVSWSLTSWPPLWWKLRGQDSVRRGQRGRLPRTAGQEDEVCRRSPADRGNLIKHVCAQTHQNLIANF